MDKLISSTLFDDEINFNDYEGIERLDREYKEFTFNLAGLKLDKKLADDYCSNNIFNFNDAVILNIKKYIKSYVTLNACASFNSNIDSKLFIGINDDGFIKGIPYYGEFPIKEIKVYIFKILSENLKNNTLGSIDFNKYVKIKITKINKPEKPIEKIHPEYSKYLKKKKKHKEMLEKFSEEIIIWRTKFDFVNQKLFRLINNKESRLILIEYIKSIDSLSNVINLLNTDYQEVYQPHEVVMYLKEDINSPYYWVTRWKDLMIKKLRKEKPVFIKSLANVTTNLIMNVSEMTPWWVHYNNNMTLSLLEFDFLSSLFGVKFEIKDNNLFSYYDHDKEKWSQYYRTIFNGGPACCPI